MRIRWRHGKKNEGSGELASTTSERERSPSRAECVAAVHYRGSSPAWPQQRPPAVDLLCQYRAATGGKEIKKKRKRRGEGRRAAACVAVAGEERPAPGRPAGARSPRSRLERERQSEWERVRLGFLVGTLGDGFVWAIVADNRLIPIGWPRAREADRPAGRRSSQARPQQSGGVYQPHRGVTHAKQAVGHVWPRADMVFLCFYLQNTVLIVSCLNFGQISYSFSIQIFPTKF
jgi:hypothetical protein